MPRSGRPWSRSGSLPTGSVKLTHNCIVAQRTSGAKAGLGIGRTCGHAIVRVDDARGGVAGCFLPSQIGPPPRSAPFPPSEGASTRRSPRWSSGSRARRHALLSCARTGSQMSSHASSHTSSRTPLHTVSYRIVPCHTPYTLHRTPYTTRDYTVYSIPCTTYHVPRTVYRVPCAGYHAIPYIKLSCMVSYRIAWYCGGPLCLMLRYDPSSVFRADAKHRQCTRRKPIDLMSLMMHDVIPDTAWHEHLW